MTIQYTYLVSDILAIGLKLICSLDWPMLPLIWSGAKVLGCSFLPNVGKYMLRGVSFREIPVFCQVIAQGLDIVLYHRK